MARVGFDFKASGLPVIIVFVVFLLAALVVWGFVSPGTFVSFAFFVVLAVVIILVIQQLTRGCGRIGRGGYRQR